MSPAIFVLHVRSGYEARAQHIERMMAELGLPFEYILDGDIPDLTPEWIEANFTHRMQSVAPHFLSCSTKHLIAMRQIVERGLPGALILEDDIDLDRRRFNRIFEASIRELEEAGDAPAMISYEDTRLRFVEHSRLVPERYIYPGDRDRMAGAYYVNQGAAAAMLEYARTRHLDEPIDLACARLLREGVITYWWCHPTIATQGSFSGAFRSSLTTGRPNIAGILWRLKRAYRRLLYRLR